MGIASKPSSRIIPDRVQVPNPNAPNSKGPVKNFMSHEIIIEAGKTERQYWKDLWRYRELFLFLSCGTSCAIQADSHRIA